MQIRVRKAERRVEPQPGQAAGVTEADRSRRGALLRDVPDERDVLRLLGVGTRPDVGLDLREEVQRVETLVIVLDRVGVEHHAGTLAQLAADDVVLRPRIAGDLHDRDARDVDIVFDVGGAGLAS